MTERTVQAGNITMSGGGLYSLATIGAKDVIDIATPRVLQALAEVRAQRNTDAHWCFSDMGCADGGTSLDMWRSVIASLRQDDQRDIQIVYADQANNDFNALVKIVHGMTEFDAYLNSYDNIRIFESGASFYTPALPANTLDLGFSATAMHWLSATPCELSNHVHMVGAQGNELRTFATQAATDWQTILLHRAREMRPGARLVLVNFCIDEQGRYLGNTGGINMFDCFNRNWQQLLDEGVITASEYKAMTLPQYYNRVEEFSAPLLDEQSEVYKSGLRLSDIETAVVPCPFAEDFKQHGNAVKFADAYLPTIRSWNESVFAGGLSTTRSSDERAELIEHYYNMYHSQIVDSPQGHGMGYVHAYMTIEKVT
jgi:hypothetical protein